MAGRSVEVDALGIRDCGDRVLELVSDAVRDEVGNPTLGQ